MSYEYLVMNKEELIEMLGGPIDVTPVTTQQKLDEGWPVDEDGKDVTNYSYGRKGEKSAVWTGDDVSEATKYMRNYRKGIKKGFNYEARAKQDMSGANNGNWKGGHSKTYNENLLR